MEWSKRRRAEGDDGGWLVWSEERRGGREETAEERELVEAMGWERGRQSTQRRRGRRRSAGVSADGRYVLWLERKSDKTDGTDGALGVGVWG